MGEILMNHMMFADDICEFCPSVCGLESILNVCQAYAESHEITFNCHKTICMTFKAKTAKSAVIPLMRQGIQRVNYVTHYKFLGLYEILSFQMTRHSETTVISKTYFSECLNALKNALFRFFCTSMYVSQSCCDFSKAYVQRLRVACI